MITKRRVALNGIWLDEVDDRIVITSVEPADGKESITDTNAASGYGKRITGNRRDTLDLVIKFRLWEHGRSEEGMMERSLLMEKVNAWAAPGGTLTVNYKPNRRLNVILVQAPGEGSLLDFSTEYSLTFRAYTTPYWEDEEANRIAIGGGKTGSGECAIEGSAATQCNVTLTNVSGAQIKGVTVSVGGKTMYFGSTTLAAGAALVVDHRNGLVRIRVKSAGGTYRNVMAEREVSSADDFFASPGACALSYSAQRACTMDVSWRCRYL